MPVGPVEPTASAAAQRVRSVEPQGPSPAVASQHSVAPRLNPATATARSKAPAQGGFQGVLGQVLREQEGLRFSAHARARLAQRGIPLNDGAHQRLLDAVRRAEAKGAREAVVLMDDVAYVVSVRNRTVITVVDGPRLKENVFTNIDSVVIA